MSRTYRHINKNLEKNRYAKIMYMQWFESQTYYDNEEERKKAFEKEFHRDGYRHNADKSYRKIINRSKRSKFKNELIRNINNNTIEKIEIVKWHKDANLWYF